MGTVYIIDSNLDIHFVHVIKNEVALNILYFRLLDQVKSS